jgi:hypothetical protein
MREHVSTSHVTFMPNANIGGWLRAGKMCIAYEMADAFAKCPLPLVPSFVRDMKTTHGQRSSAMKNLGTAAIVGLTTVLGLSFAAPSAAEARSAVDTIAQLEAQGHHVQLNGSSNVPLSQCKVTGVHGLNNSNIDSSGSRIDENLFTTVYVNVACSDV